MFGFLEPYMMWLRILALVGAFAAGCWATHRYYLGEEAERATAVLNATHDGWSQATVRWQTRATRNAKIDQENERQLAALRAQVRALNEEIDHVNLIGPTQVGAVCPDPRLGEWLRLYNDAARAGAGPEAAAPVGVPQAASANADGT